MAVDIAALFGNALPVLPPDPCACRFCEEPIADKPLETGMDGESMPPEVHCSETCRDADLVKRSLANPPKKHELWMPKKFNPRTAKPVESWNRDDFT